MLTSFLGLFLVSLALSLVATFSVLAVKAIVSRYLNPNARHRGSH